MPTTMMFRPVQKFGVALSTALLVMAAPAHAALITQSMLATGPTPSGFGGSFNQFDPTLGTLDAVSLNFSGNGTFLTTFAPDPARCFGSPCGAHASYSLGLNFNAPGYPIRFSFSAPFYEIVNGGVFADASNLAPQTIVFGVQIGPLDADPSAFSSYIGTNLVNVAGSMSEDSDTCEDNGVSCTQVGHFNILSTLTYDFTPVPEPFTLSLFGIGAAGLAAMRRRKNKTT